jgi:hypothetical protein
VRSDTFASASDLAFHTTDWLPIDKNQQFDDNCGVMARPDDPEEV